MKSTSINAEMKATIRIPYALRLVPDASFASLLDPPESPKTGDIVLARIEKIGRNRRLELANGRASTLHDGDLAAVVFGNRYATRQYEGYARSDGIFCDLLSMGGLCGLVESKYTTIAEPSKLRLMGALGDAQGRPLRLGDFAPGPTTPNSHDPRVIVICGSSMDAGKTHTAMSLIVGLCKQGERTAAIKLTGTVSGRDTWSLFDAGARPALDFVDGGFPSTYGCTLETLLELYTTLLTHAAAEGAEYVVVEIADGLLQDETAALLQCDLFTSTVSSWLLATSDPLAGLGGINLMREWGIEPLAVSGTISMSPLAMREVQASTGVRCVTASQLQCGDLNEELAAHAYRPLLSMMN